MKSFTYFAPHKTALTVSVVVAIGSLIFVIPMAFLFSLIPATGPNGEDVDVAFPVGMMLVMPILYFVMGYLSTAFFAWLYNKVAKHTGGITFEISE